MFCFCAILYWSYDFRALGLTSGQSEKGVRPARIRSKLPIETSSMHEQETTVTNKMAAYDTHVQCDTASPEGYQGRFTVVLDHGKAPKSCAQFLKMVKVIHLKSVLPSIHRRICVIINKNVTPSCSGWILCSEGCFLPVWWALTTLSCCAAHVVVPLTLFIVHRHRYGYITGSTK